MKQTLRIFCSTILLTCVLAAPAFATGGDDHANTHHPNRHAALFVGSTTIHGHSYFTVGGDFEYRLSTWQQRIGVGALVDAAVGEHPHTIIGGGLFIHPGYNLKVIVAPSVEFKDGHRKALLRTGVGIDFHVNHVSFTPLYNIDYVGGKTAHVYGVAFGLSF